MALSLTITFGAPCAGGNHFIATVTLTPGGARSFEFTRADLAEAVTPEERDTFARLLLRAYGAQLAGQTLLQMKTAIEAKTLNLTVS